MKKSLTPITDYYELVYKLWKSEYEKSRKLKPKKVAYFSDKKNEDFSERKKEGYKEF